MRKELKGLAARCMRCGGPLKVPRKDRESITVSLTRRQARTVLAALRQAETLELDELLRLKYRAAKVVLEEWVGKEKGDE